MCQAKKGGADIDLVLASHNHNFQQSKLLTCNSDDRWSVATDPNDPNNFMYYVVGGGGRDLYSLSGSHELIPIGEKSYGFLDIQVSGSEMLAQYIKSDGTVKYPLSWVFN